MSEQEEQFISVYIYILTCMGTTDIKYKKHTNLIMPCVRMCDMGI